MDDHVPAQPSELAHWDPVLTKRVMDVIRPIVRRYFRSSISGLEHIPDHGTLIVSNHSGGPLALDFPLIANEYYEKFGYSRPLWILSHDSLFVGPLGKLLAGLGFIHANRANAAEALGTGAPVIVFPGGDWDAVRPTSAQNVIDFGGRTGYVETAISAGASIVPVVSIGAQESQLFLSRGMWLARALRLDKALRTKILPISIGVPFGLTVPLVNMPLPTKITTKVLPMIDVKKQFGGNPDVTEVDSYVRSSMQSALDELARNRRLPVIG